MISVDIGSAIRRVRLSRGMTQAQLGEKIRCRKSLICDYEKNWKRASVDQLEKIAEALDVPLSYIICLADVSGCQLTESAKRLVNKCLSLSAEEVVKLALETSEGDQ